jgi:DNA-binding NarL/FixJ family response regulator
MEKEIKILLANDHAILRSHIIDAIKKGAPDIQIVGEASSFEELVRILPNTKTDILMTDDAMPDRLLLQLLPSIKEQYPQSLPFESMNSKKAPSDNTVTSTSFSACFLSTS